MYGCHTGSNQACLLPLASVLQALAINPSGQTRGLLTVRSSNTTTAAAQPSVSATRATGSAVVARDLSDVPIRSAPATRHASAPGPTSSQTTASQPISSLVTSRTPSAASSTIASHASAIASI